MCAGDKFRNAKDDSTKCPVCSKTVYKAEELQAIGSVWHKQCFTCGGITDQGCKRKLALGAFQTLNKVPFCSACGDRLAKESQTIMAKTSFPIHSSKDSISGGSAEDTFSGPPTTALPSPPVDTFQSFELSDDFGKPGLQNTAANKFRVGKNFNNLNILMRIFEVEVLKNICLVCNILLNYIFCI